MISRWGVEGFNIIQKNIVEDIPVGPITIKLQETDALDFLLGRFHENYRSGYWFGDLTGTLALDIYALLFMILIITFFIYKKLKNKDSVKIN